MPLQSMTGFSRSEGGIDRFRWVWELRSVNGKGLDLRFRLPTGFEHMEPVFRKLAGDLFSRGNIQINLTVTTAQAEVEAVVNETALAAIFALQDRLKGRLDPAPMRIDTLLAIRGIVDFREKEPAEDDRLLREDDILSGFAAAASALLDMREREGEALAAILLGQVDRIESLTDCVERDPSRSPVEIARKIQMQLAALLEQASTLDRDRLHTEAALLATKADLREEVDRLRAHIAAARELLQKGGPVGRKLDFLSQEFNRESNTICSKSTASAVTTAGIELKVIIDQFREQVQNLE
jgi:uncharacterized protein (TIGR00255 family)